MGVLSSIALLLPIIIFVILDLYSSSRIAVIGSIVISALVGIVLYFYLDQWDHSLTIELILFSILGFVSLRLNNPVLFKYQPVIMGVGVGVYLLLQNMLEGAFLLEHLRLFDKLLSPEQKMLLMEPGNIYAMKVFSYISAPVIILHAAILFIIARRTKTIVWAIWRAMIWPILLVVFFGINIYAHLYPRDQEPVSFMGELPK